jgi:polyisoprenyl-phosphate glycosyltransferase
MSKRALAALLLHNEVNLFLRDIIPTLGFKTSIVPYSRQSRAAGKTKYTLRKMAHLALDGVTSFSIAPLRFVSCVGLTIFLTSMSESVVPGWASTVLPVLLAVFSFCRSAFSVSTSAKYTLK